MARFLFTSPETNFVETENGTFRSNNIRYKQGTKTNVTSVAYKTAKPRATAIGMTNEACKLVSNIIGRTPAKVVIDVSVIALKRAQPASTTASLIA